MFLSFKKFLSFLYLVTVFSLIQHNSYSQGCGQGNVALNADGTFESLAGIASGSSLNNNVTAGGWTNGTGTADSWISPLPNTTQSNYAAGMPSSPDGGIFAGVWSNGSTTSFSPETFFSTLIFLEVGKKHILKFYMANAGYNPVNVGDSSQIAITFGSETKLSPKIPFLGIGNQVWTQVTMEFFPTATTQQLTIAAVSDGNGKRSYMAIDGISMVYETGSTNNKPLALDDGNSLDEGGITSGNVLNNDSDSDGDVLEVSSVILLPSYGTITMEKNGDYVYQHDGDEQYSDLITYVTTDGVCFDTADVVLSINPVNDPPVVVQDTFYVNEGDTLTITNLDSTLIVKNDLDPDNTNNELSAQLIIPPIHHAGGVFAIGSRGAFQYIHDCDDKDSVDIFQYKVSDGLATSLMQDSVIIIIRNEAPFGEPDYYSVDNGATLSIDSLSGVLDNDLDSNLCDVLRVTLLQAPTNHLGTFTLDPNGAFVYIHDGTFLNALDYFVYQLSDGEDDAIETDTAFITINMPPPTSPDTLTYAVDEGKELVVDSIQGLLKSAVSNIGLPHTLTAEVIQGPLRGTILPAGDVNPNGSFVYKHDCTDMPNADYFLFKIRDSLTVSDTITVFITINNICPIGQNDEYTIDEGQTINIDTTLGVLVNDTDDNICDPLSVTLVTPPLYHVGGFTLNSDGSFLYTHDDSENFQDQFSYRLSDGECTGAIYTVTINVDSISDKPPIANDDGYIPCIKEGETLDVSMIDKGVLGNDTDPDVKDSILTAVLIESTSHGTLIFNDDGTFTYTHDGGEDIVDYFTYVAYDGDFYSLDTAVVTICIDQVNDCPQAFDDIFFINEGQVLDSTVAKNDTDGDINTDDNNYAVTVAPSIGTLDLRSDGSFVYTPPAQITPPGPEIVTFEYQITDPDPSTSCLTSATVTIRINSINDCPVANDDTINVDALKPGVIIKDIIANDTDIDNSLDSSSIFIADPPLYGDLIVNNDGTISYNYIGSPSKRDSITYAVQDSVGCLSNFAKIWINIENIQFPEYELPSYFTPNGDRFNDYFTIKYKNIIIENVKFEVKILDRYQRIIFEAVRSSDIIWDGIDENTSGDAKKGFYYYEITPIEYGNTRTKSLVGVIFLDR